MTPSQTTQAVTHATHPRLETTIQWNILHSSIGGGAEIPGIEAMPLFMAESVGQAGCGGLVLSLRTVGQRVQRVNKRAKVGGTVA